MNENLRQWLYAEIRVDENYERNVVDPAQELEANAYYSGGNIRDKRGRIVSIL